MFCCIAIVGIAIAYFGFLTTRQLVIGISRDKSSPLPVPPRALTGNKATPVFGHTWLFRRLGGDLALNFPPEWREWKFLPWSRVLGDCFALFIWGQWRVVIRGPERAQYVMDCGALKEDWAWSPPVGLLGNKCLALIEGDAADFMYDIIEEPLSHRRVQVLAPEFARITEHFMDDLVDGRFKSRREKQRENRMEMSHSMEAPSSESESASGDEEAQLESRSTGDSVDGIIGHKIKFDALRSLSLDLLDGPILRMDRWQSVDSSSKEDLESDAEENNEKKPLGRRTMMIWMDRLKRSMCAIKMTFGTEWMYVWLLNHYGRAVNGRMHIERVISDHVNSCSKSLSIEREVGYTFKDPFATKFPIKTMAENYFYQHETATGKPIPPDFIRQRTLSEPNLSCSFHLIDPSKQRKSTRKIASKQFAVTFESQPVVQKTLSLQPASDADERISMPRPPLPIMRSEADLGDQPPLRGRASTCPGEIFTPPGSPVSQKTEGTAEESMKEEKIEGTSTPSILDTLLQRVDEGGNGLTCAAITDTSILLWMMMDAGNAWTAMALNLLSLDQGACIRVHQELDELASLNGRQNLFTPKVMDEMIVLDGLIYEAIRLCPPFLGGMKKASQTFELSDVGLQIPKNTHLIFCQPTEESFNLGAAIGKKPHELGLAYPSPELYGFLPLKGLEVPLMVLQSKVFIAVCLERFSPFLSKKRTFIRKLKSALHKSRFADEQVSEDDPDKYAVSSIYAESDCSIENFRNSPGLDHSKLDGDTTQTEAMQLFDKIPFPEPRRVMYIRERLSALKIIGVQRHEHS